MNKRQERALEVFLYVTFAIALVMGVGTTKSDPSFLSTSMEPTMSDGDSVSYGKTFTTVDSYEDMQLQSIISFAANNDQVNALGRRELIKHATVLTNNPHLILNISGHADSSESVNFNKALGDIRATRVYELLVSYGTPKEQLIVDSVDQNKWDEQRCVELQYLSTVLHKE